MKKAELIIWETKNYSIFNTQEGNRDICKNDVRKVERKILKENLLKYHPILVDNNFFVLDGQHRLKVAVKNNLTIYYMIVKESKGIETTQSINTTGKPWTVRDFLKSYIERGNETYILFGNILNKYKFLTISQLIELSSVRLNSVGYSAEAFRNGEHAFRDVEFLIRVLDSVQLYSQLNIGLESRTHFQRFMNFSLRKGVIFDHNRMMQRIKRNLDYVKRLPNDHYIISDMLGEIYNHKLRTKINFNLREIK